MQQIISKEKHPPFDGQMFYQFILNFA